MSSYNSWGYLDLGNHVVSIYELTIVIIVIDISHFKEDNEYAPEIKV